MTQVTHKYPTRQRFRQQSSEKDGEDGNGLVEVTRDDLMQQQTQTEENYTVKHDSNERLRQGEYERSEAVAMEGLVDTFGGEDNFTKINPRKSRRSKEQASKKKRRSRRRTRASDSSSSDSMTSDSESKAEKDHHRRDKRHSKKGHPKSEAKRFSDALLKLMNQQNKQWEGLLERLTPRESASTSTRGDARAPTKDTVPKFKELQRGQDVATYLDNFEDYMENWGVPKSQWTYRLLPLLTQEAMEVFSSLPADGKKNNDTVRRALCKHFCITREGYKWKLDEMIRGPGEHWAECARRIMKVVYGWTEHCTSVNQLREWIAADRLLQIMPHQIATRVRERRPDKLRTLRSGRTTTGSV